MGLPNPGNKRIGGGVTPLPQTVGLENFNTQEQLRRFANIRRPGMNEVSSGADLAQQGGNWAGWGNRMPTVPGSKPGIGAQTGGLPQATSGPLDVTGRPDVAGLLSKGGGANYANTLGALTNSDGSSSAGLNKGMPPQVDPATGGNYNKTNFAPTSAQTAANPGQFVGTSFDPTRNIRLEAQGPSGGATSMGMQGAGIGSQGAGYYGANAPLDLSRFTPEGGAGTAWYNHLFGQNNPNNISYLQFTDQLGRNALGGRQSWGEGGALQDQLNYMNSQEGQAWLSGLMGLNQQQQQQQPVQETPPPPPPTTTQPTANPEATNPNSGGLGQQAPNPQQIMDSMLANGMSPRDIPIQLRLMAQGIQPREMTAQGYTPVQNPFVSMMQNGMGNPFMQMMMAMGGGK